LNIGLSPNDDDRVLILGLANEKRVGLVVGAAELLPKQKVGEGVCKAFHEF